MKNYAAHKKVHAIAKKVMAVKRYDFEIEQSNVLQIFMGVEFSSLMVVHNVICSHPHFVPSLFPVFPQCAKASV